MRIVCPSCSAAYDVPDDRLTMGQLVRCSRCQTEWSPPLGMPPPGAEPTGPQAGDPPAATAAADTPPWDTGLLETVEAEEAVEEALQQPDQPQRAGGEWKLRVAWAASLVGLLLVAWGCYAWRGDVMRVWPPSARLYSALGVPAGMR